MTTVAQVTHLADAVGASTELRLHDGGQTLLITYEQFVARYSWEWGEEDRYLARAIDFLNALPVSHDSRPSRETCDELRRIYPERPVCTASHYGDPVPQEGAAQ